MNDLDAMRARLEKVERQATTLRESVVRADASIAEYRATIERLRAENAELARTQRLHANRVTPRRLAALVNSQLPTSNLPPGTVRYTVHGLHFTTPADDAADGTLAGRLAKGDLPLEQFALVRQFVVGGVMLDIGANIGTTAIPRVILGDFQTVYCAEPHPGNFACLAQNIADNRVPGAVLPSQVAIGCHDGTASLGLSTRTGGHSLNRSSTRERIDVPALTLDSWVAQLRIDPAAIRFVKVDVQGWEGHVLAGAQALSTLRPVVWQLEVSPSHLARSGVDVAAFYALLADRFDWCFALDGTRVRPARRIADVVQSALQAKRFTDVLLGHGTI